MEIPGILREFLRASFMMRVSQNFLYEDESCVGAGKLKFWQPWLDADDGKQSTTKQLPTTKWKRDRRSRLPEYSRKSDPKIPEVFNGTDAPPPPGSPDSAPTTPTTPQPPPSFQNGGSPPPGVTNAASQTPAENGNANGRANGDYPLDMSVRQRGLPPSYSQTVNHPNYRSSYRRTAPVPQGAATGAAAAVVAAAGGVREDLPSGISMCDPIIDEHFRRSLGEDYLTLFTNNNVAKEPPRVKTPPKVATNVIELMDSTGLSVDDHFAKALGDTWLKLNKKESERNANTASDMVST